jgi:hypothetical protein
MRVLRIGLLGVSALSLSSSCRMRETPQAVPTVKPGDSGRTAFPTLAPRQDGPDRPEAARPPESGSPGALVRVLVKGIVAGSTPQAVASELGVGVIAAEVPSFWQLTSPNPEDALLLEARTVTSPILGAELLFRSERAILTFADLTALWGPPTSQRAARQASASFDIKTARLRAVAYLNTRTVVPGARVSRLVFHGEQRTR